MANRKTAGPDGLRAKFLTIIADEGESGTLHG